MAAIKSADVITVAYDFVRGRYEHERLYGQGQHPGSDLVDYLERKELGDAQMTGQDGSLRVFRPHG
jgi:hypothetical protein